MFKYFLLILKGNDHMIGPEPLPNPLLYESSESPDSTGSSHIHLLITFYINKML